MELILCDFVYVRRFDTLAADNGAVVNGKAVGNKRFACDWYKEGRPLPRCCTSETIVRLDQHWISFPLSHQTAAIRPKSALTSARINFYYFYWTLSAFSVRYDANPLESSVAAIGDRKRNRMKE